MPLRSIPPTQWKPVSSSTESYRAQAPMWVVRTLVYAGVYNVVWAMIAVFFPSFTFQLLGLASPSYPALWQTIGMTVGVMGVGYLLASLAPYRHWLVVFLGMLASVLGPLGFLVCAARGEFPWLTGVLLVSSAVVWWVPFAKVLLHVAAAHREDGAALHLKREDVLAGYLEMAETQTLESVHALSHRHPVLMVFLRHFGCTFCRETLRDLGARRSEIEADGTRIVVVHMSDEERAAEVFATYGLHNVYRVRDTDCDLYRAFGLERGTLMQLFGPRVWMRGLVAGVLDGHGIGGLEGDGWRMPGVFLVSRGVVVNRYIHRSASDRPDYGTLARCPDPGLC